MALSVRIVREFFPEADSQRLRLVPVSLRSCLGQAPARVASPQEPFSASATLQQALREAHALVSRAWEAEKTRSMASLDWQNSGAREQERNSQSTAKTTPHEALGQAEPIGPA